jgi:hypothetical protein
MQFCTSADTGGGMGGGGPMVCFNCQRPGHRASECPNAGPGAAGGLPFNGMPGVGPIGSGLGGMSGLLGGSDLGMGGMRGSDEDRPCMRCGQKGHRSLECPTRSGGVRILTIQTRLVCLERPLLSVVAMHTGVTEVRCI